MREILIILVLLKCIKSEALADCDEDICCHLGEGIWINNLLFYVYRSFLELNYFFLVL